MHLTHRILVAYSNGKILMSPFVIFGLSGLFCPFYSILHGESCQQTLKTLIRRHIVWRLILGLNCLPMTLFTGFPVRAG